MFVRLKSVPAMCVAVLTVRLHSTPAERQRNVSGCCHHLSQPWSVIGAREQQVISENGEFGF
jgi:hypothetical protein